MTIPESPGSYQRFIHALGRRNVSEFNYRYSGDAHAHIFVGVQVARAADAKEIAKDLRAGGYEIVDLTDNRIAKIHARHLIGGRAPGLRDEKLFSFEFPERPGALRNFLDRIGATWNITLFHYRNHGFRFWARSLRHTSSRPRARAV